MNEILFPREDSPSMANRKSHPSRQLFHKSTLVHRLTRHARVRAISLRVIEASLTVKVASVSEVVLLIK